MTRQPAANLKQWKNVYLGLGSNEGNRRRNLLHALGFLKKNQNIAVKKVSSIYESSPVGLKQRNFLNNALFLKTTLSPFHFFDAIKNIEKKMGRKKTVRWGPRIIDLDIIAYGKKRICSEKLIIPHQEFHRRKFVLLPLSEIAPRLKVTGFKKTVSEILSELTDHQQRVKLFLK